MTRKGIKIRIRRYTKPFGIEIAPWLWPLWLWWQPRKNTPYEAR